MKQDIKKIWIPTSHGTYEMALWKRYLPKLCIRELNNFNSGAPNAGATLPAKTMNGRSKNVIKLSSRGGHAENEFVLSITANLAATSG